MQDFRDLDVWQKSRGLAVAVYQATNSFPATERFGLTCQIRRCATSIAANIAEGCGRGSDTDFGRFVQMAIGSACELDCHFIIAYDLKFIEKDEFVRISESINEIRKMLIGLRQRLRS